METLNLLITCKRLLMLTLMLTLTPAGFAQDKVDQAVEAGISRNKEAAASQKRVDKIAVSTEKLAARYKRELKVIDGLKVYNALLQKQLELQVAEMEQLRSSIEEVSIIERQITPLMLRMVDGLEQFINLDVPFLQEERKGRVERLRQTIGRADVTAAEKFRNVLEAYQIENDYGRTIEAYKDVIDGREVSLLRFGRVSLVYQTEDGSINKAWDQKARKWADLDAAEYRNHIAKGLKIARKQVAPDLIMLPVNAAGGAK